MNFGWLGMSQTRLFKMTAFLSVLVFATCYGIVQADSFSRKEQCTPLSRDYVHELLKEVRKSQPKTTTTPDASGFLRILPIFGSLTPISVSNRHYSASGGLISPYGFLQVSNEVKEPLCPSKQEQDISEIVFNNLNISFIIGHLYQSPLYARFAYGTLPFGRHD